MFTKSNIRKITIAFEKTFHSEVYLALGKVGIILAYDATRLARNSTHFGGHFAG